MNLIIEDHLNHRNTFRNARPERAKSLAGKILTLIKKHPRQLTMRDIHHFMLLEAVLFHRGEIEEAVHSLVSGQKLVLLKRKSLWEKRVFDLS